MFPKKFVKCKLSPTCGLWEEYGTRMDTKYQFIERFCRQCPLFSEDEV